MSRELPPGWEMALLGEIAEIKGGIQKGKARATGIQTRDVHYLRVANVQRGYLNLENVSEIQATDSEIESLRLMAGDVLFNEGGDPDKLGRGWVWQDELPLCIHQNHVFRARPRREIIDSKFLSYFSNGPGKAYFLEKAKQTTGIASINTKQLQSFPVHLPPLSEQRRIVARIEELTARSKSAKEALQAIPPLLEKFRQSVLAAAFRGDLTAEWRRQNPDVEPAEVLLERIRVERRRRWEESGARGKYVEPEPVDASGLPELPKGWCWCKLEEICRATTGMTPLRSETRYYEGGRIPWITSGALNADLIVKPTAFITKQAIDENRLPMVPAGSLLVALYGEGKTRGLCSELTFNSTTNQAIAALIFEQAARGLRHWIRYSFKKNYAQLRMQASGGVQPNLNLSMVKSLLVPMPPASENLVLIKVLDSAWSQLAQIKCSMLSHQALAGKFDESILSKAFRGELIPQDPSDEPAAVLLERIRSQTQSQEPTSQKKRR